MTYSQLIQNIKRKHSFLCVGLDSDIQKIPGFLYKLDDPVFEFNKKIVDATQQYTVAYKPNLAFYESAGKSGWETLEKTVEYIKLNHPDIFIIADAKRGDIGNTSRMYAKAFLENMPFDAITVAPYMGSDSVMPFLEIKNKWVVILALTSNQGAFDFQFTEIKQSTDRLFEKVIQVSKLWGTHENIMYVVGATKAEMLSDIRKTVPDHFLLIPGIGAQGGDLDEVAKNGLNKNCGLLINASRSVIFASSGEDFAESASKEAASLQKRMEKWLL